VYEALAILYHLRLAVKHQQYRPPGAADVDRLVRLGEHQNVAVDHVLLKPYTILANIDALIQVSVSAGTGDRDNQALSGLVGDIHAVIARCVSTEAISTIREKEIASP
jgi:hypothetical protein